MEEFYSQYLDWVLQELEPHTKRHYRQILIESDPTKPIHEKIGQEIRRRIKQSSAMTMLPILVIDQLEQANHSEGHWAQALQELISGEVDIDRLDYLLRDTRNSGTEFAAFDKERLLQSIELHPSDSGFKIGFGIRAQSALETFITQRYLYYRWVVYHYRTVAANRILNHCVRDLTVTIGLASSAGEILEAPTAVPPLNYFATAGPAVDRENKSLCLVDDSTILEWIKEGVRSYRLTGFETDRDREDARERFLALADAVLHHEQRWVSMWKTDSDFDDVAQLFSSKFHTWFPDLQDEFREWTRKNPRMQARKALGERLLSTIANSGLQGPRPLLNSVASAILSAGTNLGNAQIVRERLVADAFDNLSRTPRFDTPGIWIFAFDTISPWNRRQSARVFRGGVDVPLWRQSEGAITHLEEAEPARPQFHCYFLPTNETYPEDTGRKAKERFVSTFDKFAFDRLKQMLRI